MKPLHAIALILISFLLFSAIAPTLTTAQPACNTGADADCDGEVTLTELQGYIQLWYGCSSCYPDLYDAIGAWYAGQEPLPECGDGTCDASEDCLTCPQDCGECPAECTTTVSTAAELETAKTNAQPGDVVCLMSGDYGEQEFSSAKDTKTGTADAWITYKAAEGHEPVLDMLDIRGNYNRYLTFKNISIIAPDDSDYYAVVYVKDSSYINLIGCNVTGRWDLPEPGDSSDYGIVIDGINNPVSNVIIDGCDVKDAGRGILIYHDIREGVIIRNSHVHHVGGSIIMVATAHLQDEIIIENNHLHDRQKFGTYHGSGITLWTDHITIRNNFIHDPGGTGSIVFYSDNTPPGGFDSVVVENNLIYDPQGHNGALFQLLQSDITIRNNTFINSYLDPSGRNKYGTVMSLNAYNPSDGVPNLKIHDNIFIGQVGLDDNMDNYQNYLEEDNNIFWSIIDNSAGSTLYPSPLGPDSTIVYTDDNYFEGSGNFFVGGALFDQYSYTQPYNPDPYYEQDSSHKQNLNDAYIPVVGSDACSGGIITKGHLAGEVCAPAPEPECDYTVSNITGLNNARDSSTGGEVICLKSGNYDDFTDSRTTTGTEWITYKAVDGHTPVLEHVEIGGGGNDAYIEVDGLHITNKLTLRGNYINVKNCEIESRDFTATSTAILEGVWLQCDNILVEDCDIHYGWRGIRAGGYYWTIRNNKIHHIAEDGIKGGVSNVLVEGNEVYDLSPYYHPDYPGKDIHGDGIQWYSGSTQENIIIRGNKFHSSRINGGGALFVSAGGAPWTNIRVENNLLYDIDGNILLVTSAEGTLYFNNNTILETMPVANFRIYDATEMHNNILSKLWTNGNIASHGNNIFANDPTNIAPDPSSVVLNQTDFEDLFADYDGKDFHPLTGQTFTNVAGQQVDPCTMSTTGSYVGALECAGEAPAECTIASDCPDIECKTNKRCVSQGCVYDNMAEGTACTDDGLYCTGTEACQAGTCISSGNPCPDDGYSCTLEACSESNQSCSTEYSHSACDDSNPCTDDSCIGSGGEAGTGCSYSFNTNPCDDSDSCTTGDACSSGACQPGTAITTCTDDDGCCPASCDEGNDNDCAAVPGDYVSYWKFDGNVNDENMVNHNDGTVNGNPQYVAGVQGQALDFDGSVDYIDVGDSSSLDISGSITVLAWVNPGQNTGTDRVVSKRSGDRAYNMQQSSGSSNPKFFFSIADASNNAYSSGDTGELATGQWHHLAGVYSAGTSVRIYVDGSLANENTNSIPASQKTNNVHLMIGTAGDNACCAWMGKVDEVMVYDRALSAAEIGQIYQAQAQ